MTLAIIATTASRTVQGEVPVELRGPLRIAHGHDEAQHDEQEKQQDNQVVCLFVHLK